MQELNRTRPRAYTSVMSLLNVMTDKRLLGRSRRGRAFLYSPRVRQQQTLRELVADLLNRAFDGSAMRLVAHALEQTQPTGRELDEISRLIEEHRRLKEAEQ
jgi:predicted transcriptional regulator